MKKFIISILVFAVIIGALFAASIKHRPKPPAPSVRRIQQEFGIPVQTAQVTVGDMDETVPVTGDLAALNSAIVSANVSGRLAAVYVREGQAVSRGQVVAVLDQAAANSSLQSAKAGLISAKARVSQAITTGQVSKVQLQSAIDQAQASLNAAQARLAVAKNPTRTQERLVAQNNVDSAKANLDNAEANYKRYQGLLDRGAISVSSFETVKTQYLVAQSTYKNAQQQLSLVSEGGRPEDITSAQAQVDAAKEQLAQAKANVSQNQLREEDVKVAQAALQQAEAQVAIAQEQLNNTYLKAPLSGIISSRTADPGQVISPGQSVATIVDLSSVYFRADISEENVNQVRKGQTVQVTIDAFPGERFSGVVSEVFPAGSTANRNFNARVSISGDHTKLKPAMFARGEILVGLVQNALLVPKDALDGQPGAQAVYTVGADHVAKRHPVTVVQDNGVMAQIDAAAGLSAGDVVVTLGHQNIQDGLKVEAQQPNQGNLGGNKMSNQGGK